MHSTRVQDAPEGKLIEDRWPGIVYVPMSDLVSVALVAVRLVENAEMQSDNPLDRPLE